MSLCSKEVSEIKLPTIWTDEKQSREEAERRERFEERSRRERVKRKKVQMREKVGKSRNTVFPMICGSGGSKSRIAKAAGAEPARQVRDEKLHAVVARSTFASQNVQNTPASELRTTFGSWDVEKVHAVVARSTFPSQNVQNTPAPGDFWQWSCRKSARCCGAKHISKSKCTKHTSSGRLLAVKMSKKCTPLWREPHFQVKMYKTHHCRTTFGSWDVEKVHAVVARITFASRNVENTPCTDHFWKFRCRKSAHRCGAKHISKWKCTKHTIVGPLLEVQMSLRFTTLHYTTLQSTTLHCTTLHYITQHYNYNYTTTLHYTPLHYLPLHFTTLHYTTLHYTTTTTTNTQLHSTTLHYTKLHYTTLHYTTLHCTTLHSTTLHYTTLHYTEWHCTTDRQVDR